MKQSMEQKDLGIGGRVLRSMFPYLGLERRGSKRKFLSNFALHFRPATVDRSAIRFTLSWGLGGMAAASVVYLFVTGILLKFVYEPFPTGAYTSILALQNDILFGKLIRNVHHWSANFLVAIVFLHFLRVFFTGAFRHLRQFNWIVGLGLFALVLGSNFTGYLLPYDQLAYWAVTISTGTLDYVPVAGPWLKNLVKASPEIGSESLKIFYSLHTAVFPILLSALMAFHFWRIRKAGGLAVSGASEKNNPGEPKKVPVVPNLIVREASVAFALAAFILVLSVFFDAPLGEPANPGLSPNPTKAPWYFAGLQELLLHFHPFFAVCVIPATVFAALLLLPYRDYEQNTSGVWFASPNGRRMTVYAAAFAAVSTVLLVFLDEYLPELSKTFPGVPSLIADGVFPFIVCLAAISGAVLYLRSKFSRSDVETVQALFAILCMAFVVLTLINAVFRGPGMALIF